MSLRHALLHAIVALCAAAALPVASSLASPLGIVVAAGSGVHDYETDASCRDEVSIALEYAVASGRLLVVADSTCVAPYASIVSGCEGSAGDDIRCARDTPTQQIRALLEQSGAFSLTWIGPGFAESLVGSLERTDVHATP